MTISALLAQYGDRYLESTLMTWRLTAISFALAFVLGIVITVVRVCPIRPLRLAGDFYIAVFRNIPGAAMLVLMTTALPRLGLDLKFGPYNVYFNSVIVVTTMIPAAFCSEDLMSGMNTIDKGQIEAARALGLGFFGIIRRIVIPQALRSSVLPLTNLMVATMLTTAISSRRTLRPARELTGLVRDINTDGTGGIAAYAVAAALYCATALIIGLVGHLIDRKVRIKR